MGQVSSWAFETASAEETRTLGVALGAVLEAGDFVGLLGEMGAGKTQLVRGVAEGAGVDPREVASPTFAIVYPYEGRVRLYHADLYRLSSRDELYATGYFDLFSGDGALLVEWVDLVAGAAPADALRIELTAEPETPEARKAKVNAEGPRAEALLARWRAQAQAR